MLIVTLNLLVCVCDCDCEAKYLSECVLCCAVLGCVVCVELDVHLSLYDHNHNHQKVMPNLLVSALLYCPVLCCTALCCVCCVVCVKLDVHLSSYDHNHKKVIHADRDSKSVSL